MANLLSLAQLRGNKFISKQLQMYLKDIPLLSETKRRRKYIIRDDDEEEVYSPYADDTDEEVDKEESDEKDEETKRDQPGQSIPYHTIQSCCPRSFFDKRSASEALSYTASQLRRIEDKEDKKVSQYIGELGINMQEADLANVTPVTLASVVRHCQKIDFYGTRLSTEQIAGVLKSCISCPSLKDLNLGKNDLTEISPQLLTQAAGNLQKINLCASHLSTCLSIEQVQAMLEVCISSPTLLDVNLSWNKLEEIPCEQLSWATYHLQRMNLSNTSLTSSQVLVVFEACASSTTLEDLDIGNNYHIEKVPPKLLRTAASKLHKLSLGFGEHSEEQCVALLEACISSSTLSDLCFGDCDWTDIPAPLIQKAASNLRKMSVLTSCEDWTIKQSSAFFQACIASSTLKELCLDGVKLWQYDREPKDSDDLSWEFIKVPKEILAQAVRCLDKIELTDSREIFPDQLDTILEACISSKTRVCVIFHRPFEEDELRSDILSKSKKMGLFTWKWA